MPSNREHLVLGAWQEQLTGPWVDSQKWPVQKAKAPEVQKYKLCRRCGLSGNWDKRDWLLSAHVLPSLSGDSHFIQKEDEKIEGLLMP